jgi:hypothetical protein
MSLSRKIKLAYWQAVCTGKPHGTLDSMLSKALDKLEKENVELRKVNSSCKGILDNQQLTDVPEMNFGNIHNCTHNRKKI